MGDGGSDHGGFFTFRDVRGKAKLVYIVECSHINLTVFSCLAYFIILSIVSRTFVVIVSLPQAVFSKIFFSVL